jgi:hypothetical protein
LKSNDPVAATPEWGRLQATLAEADEIAAGKRGPYPFDKAGRDKMLAALGALAGDVDALAVLGFFAGAAADLLKKEIATLADEVSAKRPKEMEMATCYEPMPFEPGKKSARRLAERADALESLAAAGKVSPAVSAASRRAASAARGRRGTLALMKDPSATGRRGRRPRAQTLKQSRAPRPPRRPRRRRCRRD